MSYAASKIITKGLYGNVCQGMITTHFHLFPFTVTTKRPNGGTGGIKFKPPHIHPKQYNDEQDCDLPQYIPEYTQINIRVRLGNAVSEKTYHVDSNIANKVIIFAENIKAKTHNIRCSIKNIMRIK